MFCELRPRPSRASGTFNLEQNEHHSDGGCAHKLVHAAFFRPSHLSLQPSLTITTHPPFSTCTPFLCTPARNLVCTFFMHTFICLFYLILFILCTPYITLKMFLFVYILVCTRNQYCRQQASFLKNAHLYVLSFSLFLCVPLYIQCRRLSVNCVHTRLCTPASVDNSLSGLKNAYTR